MDAGGNLNAQYVTKWILFHFPTMSKCYTPETYPGQLPKPLNQPRAWELHHAEMNLVVIEPNMHITKKLQAFCSISERDCLETKALDMFRIHRAIPFVSYPSVFSAQHSSHRHTVLNLSGHTKNRAPIAILVYNKSSRIWTKTTRCISHRIIMRILAPGYFGKVPLPEVSSKTSLLQKGTFIFECGP